MFFCDVREEMSALSAAVWRVSATTPQQHHHLINLQSNLRWFGLFGQFKLFRLFRLLQFVLTSFWLFLGWFMLFFVKKKFDLPKSF